MTIGMDPLTRQSSPAECAIEWKRCSLCRRLRELSLHFPRNRTKENGYGDACKVCQNRLGRRSYKKVKVKERQIAAVRLRKDCAQERLALVVNEILNRPCAQCGESHGPDAMVLKYAAGKEPRITVREMARQGYAEETIRTTASRGEVTCRGCRRKTRLGDGIKQPAR